MIAFTIVNANYIHFALTLAESYLDKNIESEFYIFLFGGAANLSENKLLDNLKIITIDKSIVEDIDQRAFYYEITELSTSVKPKCFKFLFDKGYQKVLYLDPDICIYSDLTDLEKLLEVNSIVITPHSTTPIYDQRLPDDLNFLRAGSYNLGFIGLKKDKNSIEFLDWWDNRLTLNSFTAFSKGMFTDQKWIDLVPSYFEGVYILKSPGYNVAYWNLHERRIEKVFDTYMCNKENLKFFHFSGIDLKGDQVSKHTSRYGSYLNLNIDIVSLFENYRRRALESFSETVGFREAKYKYEHFSDGISITNIDRLLYFNSYIEGIYVDDPFSLSKREFRNFIRRGNKVEERKIFTEDRRLEKISDRISSMHYYVKIPLRGMIVSKWIDTALIVGNNSFNKINVSKIIYSLYRDEEV